MNEKNYVVSPHAGQNGQHKKFTINAGENIEEKEPSSLLVGIKAGNP